MPRMPYMYVLIYQLSKCLAWLTNIIWIILHTRPQSKAAVHGKISGTQWTNPVNISPLIFRNSKNIDQSLRLVLWEESAVIEVAMTSWPGPGDPGDRAMLAPRSGPGLSCQLWLVSRSGLARAGYLLLARTEYSLRRKHRHHRHHLRSSSYAFAMHRGE